MTRPLVRYVGPKRAYRGAIGYAVNGGAEVQGRLVRGLTVAPDYVVSCDGVTVSTRATWEAAVAAMPGEVTGDATPDGAEIVVDDAIWRLTVR